MRARFDEETKAVFLEAVASGELLPVEAARALGLSRATGFRWAKGAGIDWQTARYKRVTEWLSEQGLSPRRAKP